jgi:hypothetical protein
MKQNNELSCFNSVNDFEKLANALHRSGMSRSKEEAFALMAIAQSEKIHPARAVMEYHVIKGKPSLKADVMLARFQEAGGKVKWTKSTDDIASAVFSHPKGGEIAISWDMERAKKARLIRSDVIDTSWHKYPAQMLRARVISEAIRAIYPGVLSGFYAKEELEDSDDHSSTTKLERKPIEGEYEEVKEEDHNQNKEENNNHEFNIENVKNEINACTDINSLKDVFGGYYHVATKLCIPPQPQSILDEMIAAKNSMKAKLAIIEEKNKVTETPNYAANVEEMEKVIMGTN